MYIYKGETFNRLTALENVLDCRDKTLFKCDCLNIKRIRASAVKHNNTKSCGCLRKEMATKHGYRYHIAYICWHAMIDRCYNINCKEYENYGKRNIQVCTEWKNSPEIFCDWALENGFKKELQIDRINNDGNYSPENCRFVTPSQNSRNKRNNYLLTAFGKTQILVEWIDDNRCNVSHQCVYARLKRGWSPEKAITTPVRKKIKK